MRTARIGVMRKARWRSSQGTALRGVHGRQAPAPSQELNSRAALAPVFADLNKYAATLHFVGQSTILSLAADRATGEAYCMAHHLTVDGDKRR